MQALPGLNRVMSIDEFLLFALDVVQKKKGSMEEFKTRLSEAKKEWIENHKGDTTLFDTKEEKEEEKKEEKEEKEEEADDDSVDYSQLLPTMYGDMTYIVLRSRYNIDYEKAAKSLMQKKIEEYTEIMKEELEHRIAEKIFDIQQIDIEIRNAEQENAPTEQLEELMREKKELQDALYQMKKDLKRGNYTNSL